MTEYEWDKKLKIHTVGRDASNEDNHHYPYEPTPYVVLERLAESGYINVNTLLVDYGCGKGRVGFFLNDRLNCKTIGIEYDENIFEQAKSNNYSYKGDGCEFVCASAENYEIESADAFYFFNPFSINLLQAVIGKIVQSYYNSPRTMQLFFYYPSDEYVAYLMTVAELEFVDEIMCDDLFKGDNSRERILIFELV